MQVLQCSNDFTEIGNQISRGSKTIVYPTDTVYGLGAYPLTRAAVDKCFQIKERERGKPFPILFSSIRCVQDYALLNDRALRLAREFWPGKLTIVAQANDKLSIPDELLFENTIAVRVPGHDCARKLIDACGGALIGTSANASGRPPAINPEDPALCQLASRADFFVKGTCGDTLAASTIVDATSGELKVIRQGAIAIDAFERLAPER